MEGVAPTVYIMLTAMGKFFLYGWSPFLALYFPVQQPKPKGQRPLHTK
jgi:hypothetical protein